MHSKIHELAFHEYQKPIYALMYTSEYIITGGADNMIVVWSHKFEYITTLTRHTTPVMILRRLNETHFISASDDGHCLVWQKSEDQEQSLFVPCQSFMKSQTIADICVYEPYVLIATISTIYIHQYIEQIHKLDFTGKLIQGVCLDPIDKIITVQFSDGGIRHMIPKSTKKYNEIKVSKRCVGDFNRMIFRKSQWLPDGSGCLAVAGYTHTDVEATTKSNSCLLFSRTYLEEPLCTFGTPLKQVTCVVIYPIPMKLVNKSTSLLGLPYRYIFAALSTDGLQLWDTEHLKPIMTAKGFHYANLTDAIFIPSKLHKWESNLSDEEMIKFVVASADGFISEFQFEASEFGTAYEIGTEEWLQQPMKVWQNPDFNGEKFKQTKTEKVVMQIKKKNEQGEMVVIQ